LTRAPARIAQSHQLGGKRPAGRRLGIVWDISMLSRVYRSGDFCLQGGNASLCPNSQVHVWPLFSPQRNLSSSFSSFVNTFNACCWSRLKAYDSSICNYHHQLLIP
jgi:hypothetical protein